MAGVLLCGSGCAQGNHRGLPSRRPTARGHGDRPVDGSLLKLRQQLTKLQLVLDDFGLVLLMVRGRTPVRAATSASRTARSAEPGFSPTYRESDWIPVEG